MSPRALMEGHSSGLPSPTGMMEFTVTGQFSSSDDTRSCGDRIRNDQLKLQGMGDSSRFPQKRWLAASQALKDTEVLEPSRKREPHGGMSLCGSSLNIFSVIDTFIPISLTLSGVSRETVAPVY